MAFAKLWSDFRGFDTAQKFGFHIQYDLVQDCRGSERGFFDFNLITDIKPTLLPLLTQAEAEKLRQGIQRERSVSHDSFVARFDLIARGLSVEGTPFRRTRDESVDLFDAHRRQVYLDLASADHDVLRATYAAYYAKLGGWSGNGLPLKDAGNGIFLPKSPGQDAGPVVACPTQRCELRHDAATGIHTEMALDTTGSAVFWRATVPGVFPRDREEMELARRDPKLYSQFENRWSFTMSSLRQFVQVMNFPAGEGAPMLAFARKIATCGFGSFELRGPAGTLRASTLGNHREIAIEWWAAPGK